MKTRGEREVVAAMAATLKKYDAFGSESDAIRCLMFRGFRNGDIVAFADDALFEARQKTVADTMARS